MVYCSMGRATSISYIPMHLADFLSSTERPIVGVVDSQLLLHRRINSAGWRMCLKAMGSRNVSLHFEARERVEAEYELSSFRNPLSTFGTSPIPSIWDN